MSRKRLIKDKPFQGEYALYSFQDDNPSVNYLDSDGVAIRYDKFSKQDLYSYSVGDEINEAVCDSIIQNAIDPFEGQFDGNGNPIGVSKLKFTGGSFIEINSMNIKNRGVNSDINDVYYRIYICSQYFFNPYKANGSLKNYNEMLAGTDDDADGGGFRRTVDGNQVALFFTQNGPNYNEGGSAGTGLFQNIRIVENFDTLSVFVQDETGVVDLDNYDAAFTPEFSSRKYAGFNPVKSMLKEEFGGDQGTDPSDLDTPYSDTSDLTTLFQQDGTTNPIYIIMHMDGDQNTTFDRSRNETISIWSINPEELFVLNAEGLPIAGKVTTLNWDNHDIEIYSTNQERTAAFTGEALTVTINTLGGIDETSAEYNPPFEYTQQNGLVTPPISSYNQNTIDDLILNTLPTNELLKPLLNPIDNSVEEIAAKYTGEFADYLPIPYVELLTEQEKDFQIYYEDRNERVLVSAPNTVNLSFDVSIHPEPYGENGLTLFYDDFTDDGNVQTQENIPLVSKFTTDYYYMVEDSESDLFEDATEIANLNYSDYIFFVVDWDDRNNNYETINDVIADWPQTIDELTEKRDENLYIPQYISNTTQMGLRNKLTHNYNTPGIKTIKTIMISHQTGMSGDGIYMDSIEPIRWKLITSRIFLDIPTNEFPDFGQVGGDDYVTIPWPYTTPVIGGVSEDSKYSKSINDILGGGKIGNLDIIDETFLVEARENDELGQNIEKMDLEQVRYFNTGSYDMNTLLEIPITQTQMVNQTVDYLSTLPFPFWFEEFNVLIEELGGTEEITEADAEYWDSTLKRPDIADYIVRSINGQNLDESIYVFPSITLGPGLNYTYDSLWLVAGYQWPPPHYPNNIDLFSNQEDDDGNLIPASLNVGELDFSNSTPPSMLKNTPMLYSEELGTNLFGESFQTLNTMGGNSVTSNYQYDIGVGGGENEGGSAGELFGGSFGFGGGGSSEECFVAGTKVKLSNGLEKNIEDIQIGEEVLSYNIHTKKLEPKKVTKLYTQVHDLVDGDITVKTKFKNGVETHNTIANPFWSKDKGFVAANADRCNELHQWVKETNDGKDTEQLEVGDTLYHYNGEELQEVKVIEIEKILEPNIRTYDITIEDNHTFFANGILTHNSGTGGEGWTDENTGGLIIGCRNRDAWNYRYNANFGDDTYLCKFSAQYLLMQAVDMWIAYLQSMPQFMGKAIDNPGFISNSANFEWEDNTIGKPFPLYSHISGVQSSDAIYGFSYDPGGYYNNSGEYISYYIQQGISLYQALWIMLSETFENYWQGYRNSTQYVSLVQRYAEGDVGGPSGVPTSYQNFEFFYYEDGEGNTVPNPEWDPQNMVYNWLIGQADYTNPPWDPDYANRKHSQPKNYFNYPNLENIFNPNYEPEDPEVDVGYPLTGCDLPSNNIFITRNGDLLYNLGEYQEGGDLIRGFQIDLTQDPIMLFNEDFATRDMIVSTGVEGNNDRILVFSGFDNLGLSIGGNNTEPSTPTSNCGTLLNIQFATQWNDAPNQYGQSISRPSSWTFSNQNAEEMDIVYWDYREGCTNPYATNYDYLSFIDDGSCEFDDMITFDEFQNIDFNIIVPTYNHPYDEILVGENGTEKYWNGQTNLRTFSDTISVGEIFINDNQDLGLSENCKLEFNTGDLTDKAIYDSSGNSNKGLIIGDYKIKKTQKNEQMRRDSYIKIPQKTKENGAL